MFEKKNFLSEPFYLQSGMSKHRFDIKKIKIKSRDESKSFYVRKRKHKKLGVVEWTERNQIMKFF